MNFKLMCFLLIGATLSGNAGQWIWENGNSEYQIVITDEADATIRRAASELQRIIQAASTVTIPIHVQEESVEKSISLTTSPALAPGEIAWESRGAQLNLSGGTSRDVLFAVYAFAQRTLGVRWFWPGDSGEQIVPLPSFALQQEKYQYRAPFPYRGIHLCKTHLEPAFETWMSRNFINIMRTLPYEDYNQAQRSKGLHLMLSNHFATLPAEQYEKTPELFAWHGGKRSDTQLCWSNPATERALMEKFRNLLQRSSLIEIFSFSPADNQNYCTCDDCRMPGVSNAWFDFYNRLSVQLRHEFPQLKLGTIAYQGYLEVPAKENLPRDIEFLEYCQYDRCFVHSFSRTECPPNRRSLRRLQEWQDTGLPLVIYGYHFDVLSASLQLPFYSLLAEEIRHFHQMGLQGTITEIFLDAPDAELPENKRHAVRNRLGLYLYCRLMWEPELDVKELIAEYCRFAFGPGAKAMEQYIAALDRLWSEIPLHRDGYFNSPGPLAQYMVNDAAVKMLEGFLDEAAKTLDSLPESQRKFHRKNIQFEREWLKEWCRYQWQENSGATIVNLPLGEDSKGVLLPPFRKMGEDNPVSPDRTEVRMGWTRQGIWLKITAFEENLQRLQCQITEYDGKVWLDDCIELFIRAPQFIAGSYRHIAVNSAGVVFDQSCDFGPEGQREWNSNIQVKAEKIPEGWYLELFLPFPDDAVPEIGDQWLFSIKRSNAQGGSSGFPNSIYHAIEDFGTLYFHAGNSSPGRLVWQHSLPDADAAELKRLLLAAGWHYLWIQESESLSHITPAADLAVCTFGAREITPAQWREVTALAETGTVVILCGNGDPGVEKLTGNYADGLKWSGFFPVGKFQQGNSFWQSAEWSKWLAQLPPPASGWQSEDEDVWPIKLSMRNPELGEFFYLLGRPWGKGWILITTADMGASGGHAVLGNRKLESIVTLLELSVSLKSPKD